MSAGLTRRVLGANPLGPGGLKRSISGPFAFQHLSHGDHSDFQSIDIATQPELTSEVNAVQVGQQSDDQVQGFPVADLSSLRSEADSQADSTEPTLPTTSAIPYLPVTPPRPQPPPKDNLMSPYSPTQFRLSRSMENFSRPTRLSVTASDLSPISDLSRRLFSMGPISPTSVLGKPLPILPDIVHAVSTRDDIALPLRTAPLPSPPRAFMEVVVEELAEEQAVPTTKAVSAPRRDEGRHTPFVPGHRKRRSQSSGELHLDAAYYNLMSMITDVEAPDQETLTSPKGKRPQRISVGVKSTEIQDWEEAIDYSWDHAAELEDGRDNSDSDATLDRPRAPQVPQENYLVVEQRAVDETSSSASTPLMMQFPDRPSQVGQSMPAVASSHAFDQEPSSPLLGLGLGPLPPVPSLSVAAPEPEPVQGTRHNHSINSTESFRPLPVRNTLSSISKSSSTESIILSIASSIIGTHRSSNSSLTMSDFAHLASFGESVESLKLDLHDPSAASDGRVRERSQETIREGSPVTPSTDAAGSPTDLSMSSRSSFVEHELYAPGSHFSIPERNSSMPGVDISKAQVGRRRAGTGNSRPRRNTRVSYSLFPTPPPN